MKMPLQFRLNGNAVSVTIEARVSLLDLLREELGLTGSKKGCDHGHCGACTVLVNGRRMLSCLKLAVSAEGCEVTTIEGIGSAEALHPLQVAFIRHDAFQCGFCTPGQIMSALEVIAEPSPKTRASIKESMSGNLCRCGAYSNIISAIMEVVENGTV